MNHSGELAQAQAEASLRKSLNRLRFEPALEAEFRRDYESGSIHSRVLLFTLSIVAKW